MGLERERSGMNSSGSGSGSEGNTKFLIPGKSLKQNLFFRGHILSPPPSFNVKFDSQMLETDHFPQTLIF